MIAVFVFVAQMPMVRAIEGDQHVMVIIAWDEEMVSYAATCGWNPYNLVKFEVELASDYLYSTFGIRFEIVDSKTWNSNNALTVSTERLKEAVFKTGYKYGFTTTSPLLIAVTAQNMWEYTSQGTYYIYGRTENDLTKPEYGAMLIRFTPDFHTNSIILHETSHLYDCDNHYGWTIGMYRYCIMQTKDDPNTGRPVCLDSHSWCSECMQHINANKRRFGSEEKAMGPWIIVPGPTTLSNKTGGELG